MARRRLCIAVPIDPALSVEIDGLRRATGSTRIGRIEPHITLVPPVNVPEDALGAALRVVRGAAASHRPIPARLGPPATFAPRNPVVFLAVGGDAVAGGALTRLRDAVNVAPIERRTDHEFHPHVTLNQRADPERIPAMLLGLRDYEVDTVLDRIQVLQETRHGDDDRGWVPIAEYPLAPTRVVGRGGVELSLTVCARADAEAALLEEVVAAELAEEAATAGEPPPFVLSGARFVPLGADPVVVHARGRDGDDEDVLLGVARGWVRHGDHEITSVVVRADRRGEGVARQLRLALDAERAWRAQD